MKVPDSMDDLLFFTNRTVGDGRIKAWVWRPMCAKCKKGRMGKPLNPKTGKVDKKSDDFMCHACGYALPFKEAEKDLKVDVIYKCPYCGYEGETTTEYKRKSWQGVPSYVFACQKCGKTIGITKKLKNIK